jgi:hypothetical protein
MTAPEEGPMLRWTRWLAAGLLVLAVAGCSATNRAGGYDKPGFVTAVKDGRLWVFRAGSNDLEEFQKYGELTKSVTRIGAGPNRMTIRAADAKDIDDYLAAK